MVNPFNVYLLIEIYSFKRGNVLVLNNSFGFIADETFILHMQTIMQHALNGFFTAAYFMHGDGAVDKPHS